VIKAQQTIGNIYRILGSTVVSRVAYVESNDDATKLWHLRLGHLNEHKMTELHKRGLLKGVQSCKLDLCDYYVLRKQTRVLFKVAEHTTKGILDYVHIDVWGSTRDSSLGRSHYFVTFIDDFSLKVWVYFMK